MDRRDTRGLAGVMVMSSRLRVVIVVPSGLPRTSGNWTTASRLEAGLAARGCQVEVHDASAVPAPDGPAVIFHALHAIRSAPAALSRARAGIDRVVVTLTGTDGDASSRTQLREVLRQCHAAVVFHAGQARPAQVIPPGVTPPVGRSQRAAYGWQSDETVFLLPSGVRPEKDPGFSLEPLGRLRAAGWRLRLAIAGPVRDAAEMERLQSGLSAARGWAEYLGEVPRSEMGSLYRSADVVLNTSLSEGLSNAVLEAMACGRPVLASDIPGNRAAIVHGLTGLLYRQRDAASFCGGAEGLLRLPRWRSRLGATAARWVRRRFAPEGEIEAYLRVYASLLGDK